MPLYDFIQQTRVVEFRGTELTSLRGSCDKKTSASSSKLTDTTHWYHVCTAHAWCYLISRGTLRTFRRWELEVIPDASQGLALLTLSWDKNWDSHSLVNGYPSFYPRIALVAPSLGDTRNQCISIYVMNLVLLDYWAFGTMDPFY